MPSGDDERRSQLKAAEDLVQVLVNAKKYNKLQDRDVQQHMKDLAAALTPTQLALFGNVALVTTTYPPNVWWSQIHERASSMLAALRAGAVPFGNKRLNRPHDSRDIFIVHGHEHGLKEAVARLVSKLGYEPVILHERPDRGRTLVEKLEEETQTAVFAIVLMTPDDEGRGRSTEDTPRARARQNVVLELGFFLGSLGRERVVVLYTGNDDFELPSDLDGRLYIPVRSIDDNDWRVRMAREMKAANLSVDLDQVL